MNVPLARASAALAACWFLFAPDAPVAAQEKPPISAKPTVPVSTKPPVDMDGVLLDDGRQIEGKYEEKAGQRWIIQPKAGGPELNVSVVNIVSAERGGFLDVKGDDSAAYAVWRACAKAAFDEKKAGGDEAAKAAQAAVLEKGVEWCKKRDFVVAPTALVNEMARVLPSKAAELETRAKELVPPGFPWKDKPDAVKQWMTWADALLPSSAVFVGKDEEDNPWGRLENAPWTDGATLCFRTRNALMFIRDMDPKVCGKALQLAEQTARACQLFLHDGEPDVVTYDVHRLEIRIHKSRQDYLDEVPMKGGKPGRKAEPWTAGFYSPVDGVSHFYVDRRATGAADIQELTRVLSHEFTHHYIEMRWMQGQSGGGDIAGYWVVEGMAEFIQNQSHRPERGLRFDDDNVVGVINTARARKAGVTSEYLELGTFMDMTHASFNALSDGPMAGSGGKRIMASERGLWYDQAGALSYFLLQKQGPDIRKKFVQYVYDHYARRSHTPAWKFIGYESLEDLKGKFDAFLRTVGG
jgi:hypothetical protein